MTTADLQRLYGGILQINTGAITEHKKFEDIVSCSGTSNFILQYLSFGRIANGMLDGKELYFNLDGGVVGSDLHVRYNVALNRLLSKPLPCVVTLECTHISHVTTLANTGSGWCYYQSNVGNRDWLRDPSCYVISDRLNEGRGRGRKQLHNLDPTGLAMLFGELVNRRNHQTLFFGTTALTRWLMRAFSLDGKSLDLSK
ncbi:hypothetical protein EJV46_18860 [Roseococcus sp. SYP-B2431]|uniref:hypothetical protein n=1 Tax=Roseococcus sp. SYP-B2431 TaxID=2496640 RepID=UPI00103E95A3|nr:hypothetical protein [Roseococcus sp. SYP-B2431]TCH96645.1 hypothetical protein EJV46_18860 [Roseococcus sp. SYP-B2431]